MMNPFLTTVEPYLLSDEKIIQEYVLFALKDYSGAPAEWTNRVLEKAFQSEELRSSLLVWLKEDTVNEASVPLLIELMKIIDPKRKHLVLKFIIALEPEWIVQYEHELAPYLDNKDFAFNRFLLEGEEDDIWDEYYSVLTAMEKKGSYDAQLFIRAKELLDVLVGKGFYTEVDISPILQRELDQPFFSFDGIFAVRAVGLLKLEKYIPVLAGLLIRDEDILWEESAEALIRFQSDQVADAVAPFVLEDGPQIYAISILSNTKTDRAAQILADSYSAVDEDGKGMIIEALTYHFTDEAFPLIEDYLTHEYENSVADMDQIFYSFYKIMNKTHPEMEAWKKEFDSREKHFAKGGSKQEPIRHQEKVGRNDQCPCGSGKKYKKCCGR